MSGLWLSIKEHVSLWPHPLKWGPGELGSADWVGCRWPGRPRTLTYWVGLSSSTQLCLRIRVGHLDISKISGRPGLTPEPLDQLEAKALLSIF